MAAGDKKKPAKSETLTIRLDPKTKFMMEFVSRLKGQTITTVVERAITEAANQAKIHQNFGADLDWRDFWSVIDAERAIKISRYPELFPTFDEEKRLSFAEEHWPFFFHTSQRTDVIKHYVEVLWPRIDEFVAVFDEKKTQDYFAASKMMVDALSKAGLKPPEWPVKPKVINPVASKEKSKYDDLDDDIPF